ncbi:integrase arm-type DNA-binding domain-containing protein [Pseudomonas veronii]|uniref:integrase arm-type DNA-binding domain-containing protein n=1 Tax=Pseudomonas veronii TaxID=76761 RepID=UPI000F81FC5B|nr:integrase arm-type DNA-binding domain-containing protein [Pseudomonas veronii]RTY77215.1 DUF4102 domain-containing protein [Pseudomonas veronii]
MPAQNLRLSDRQLKGVKPASKDYVLTDGDGLQLRVRSNGSLLWNFNYREPVTKKRINIGFGTYPELSLANARKMAVDARELLAQGIDPKVQRNTLNEAKRAETEHTFENVATAWFELKKDSVSHGMRSMASTILNEHGWDPELIEVALAHVDKDEVRSAYNRADYIERRRPMMAWWSEYIQKAATGSLLASAYGQARDRNVVPIR